MLFEISVIALGDVHQSDELAEIQAVVDAAGLPYQLGPGSTCIEGSWDEVMPVIEACHNRARRLSTHVITLIKIEDDDGAREAAGESVVSAERAAGPLQEIG